MNDSRSIRFHYLLRAVILLAFALYIGHLVQQDALHYYVAPKLARWVQLCPIPLTLMALSLAIQALFGKGSVLCDCEHRLPHSIFKSTALYGLFLFPLLLGFALPDRALGSMAASKKGISFSSLPSETTNAVRFESIDPYHEELTELAKILYAQPTIPVYSDIFSETLGAIDMYKQQFEGKEISVSGFLYRDDSETPENAFAIGRFLVQCCTADATPFGMLVDSGKLKSLPTDTWIEVRGKLQIVQYKGQEMMQIRAEAITPIAQPTTPYIYTSADSITAWKALTNTAKSTK
ncbi:MULTISPECIES: TIGR03943 family putative permease subunit [unclassified Paenibacillus]|uniref:TIGR03943 family putative permease subunit n=1 Tax=unclassified Paenibacillus TaxID=185978 RepID=UPI0011F34956|nr:TIGR03943 family protein [Paenibacillus sp. B2(2019)]KAA1190810.1 TIGR03943 family protein [Paenibacillus sp. B2(2019)]